MQMRVNKDSKTVEIWLTNTEKADTAFRDSLKPLYQQYRDQKYTVVLFLSGENDLYERTRDLLLYNRRRTAEQAARAERSTG